MGRMGPRDCIVWTVVSLFAAAVLSLAPSEARAQDELDWEEVSQFEIRVNILIATDLELQNVRQATRDNNVLVQNADIVVPPSRWAGFISLEKAHRRYFRVRRRDAAKSDEGLRRWIAEVAEESSPNIERTQALRPRRGMGRVAYASMDDRDCIFGAGAYSLDPNISGRELYDLMLYIGYCGQPRDFAQIVDFLEDVTLASQYDNRAAYAARGGARSRITKRAPEGGGTINPEDSEVVQSGTGFVVSPEGAVVTNFHVIEGCTTIRAHHRGRARAAEVVATDEDNDLALIALAGVRGADVARFRRGRAIRSGDDVIGLGFPLRGLLANQANVTVGIVSATAGIQDDRRFIQITAPVQPGNSGGPLFDRSGNVVGVIVAKLDALQVAEMTGDIPQNVNFAIKAGVARTFLASNDVAYETAPAEGRLEAADIADEGRSVTVAIECIEAQS